MNLSIFQHNILYMEALIHMSKWILQHHYWIIIWWFLFLVTFGGILFLVPLRKMMITSHELSLHNILMLFMNGIAILTDFAYCMIQICFCNQKNDTCVTARLKTAPHMCCLPVPVQAFLLPHKDEAHNVQDQTVQDQNCLMATYQCILQQNADHLHFIIKSLAQQQIMS